MKIEVVSQRYGGKKHDPYLPVVSIGRPNPLGNPFVIGRDGDRATVIRKYEAWLGDIMSTKEKGTAHIYRALRDLLDLAREHGGVNLVCWCAPEACHGDVIKDTLLFMDDVIPE